MKGVNYLVDDAGRKTHIVLDIDVWGEAWQQLLQEEALLLSHSVNDLQAELDELEQDIPQSDLDAWLKAFDKA